MGEGWETARRRDDGNDWVLFRLAAAGRPRRVELDTTHFMGNAPAGPGCWGSTRGRTRSAPPTTARAGSSCCRGRGCSRTRGTCSRWPRAPEPVTHVRLDVYPDGGLARVRLWGEIDEAVLAAMPR